MNPNDDPCSPGDGVGIKWRQSIMLLACMVAVYFFSYFQRVGVPGTIFNKLQAEFNLTAGGVAWLGALFLYIYGGMQFVTGALNDRFGAARVFLAGGLLMSLGSVAFPLSPNTFILFSSRVLVGLGASLIYISVVKAMDVLFGVKHFATLLGVILFVGYSGGLAATVPFERAAGLWGWRATLLGVGAACSLVTLYVWLLFRKEDRIPSRRVPLALSNFSGIFRQRGTIPLLLTGTVVFGTYFLLQSTLGQKFIEDYAHIGSATAAWFTFVMMVVAMTSSLASGFLSRAMGNRRKPAVLVGTALNLVAVTLLAVGAALGYGSRWFLFCYMLLAASAMTLPLCTSVLREMNRPEAVGTAVGIVNGSYYLGVAAITNVAGLVMDAYSESAVTTTGAVVYPRKAYVTLFLICAALSAGALAMSCLIRETYGVASEEVVSDVKRRTLHPPREHEKGR